MRKILVFAIIFSTVFMIKSQSLEFTTPYYDATDKWVAFNNSDDESAYLFGFLYIDIQAGFTFDYDSKIIITNEGYKRELLFGDEIGSLKVRLTPNTADVAIISDEILEQLDLPRQPKWIQVYKEDENEIYYLVKTGFLYNSVGASHNAIEPLLDAYKRDAHFQGLEFELAYAYNATKQFKEALEVLEKAIKNDPDEYFFYREMGYALKNTDRVEEAEKYYLQGLKLTKDKNQKAEIAINMAQAYFFNKKDKKKFKKWAKWTKKYAEKGSQMYDYIKLLEENWDKQ